MNPMIVEAVNTLEDLKRHLGDSAIKDTDISGKFVAKQNAACNKTAVLQTAKCKAFAKISLTVLGAVMQPCDTSCHTA